MGNKPSTASLQTALLMRKKSRSRNKRSSSQSYTTPPESTQRDPPVQAQDEPLQRPEPAYAVSAPKEPAPPLRNNRNRSVFDLQYSTKPRDGKTTVPELALVNPAALRDDTHPIIPGSIEYQPSISGTTTLRPNTAESPPITPKTLVDSTLAPLQLHSPTSLSPPRPPDSSRPIPNLRSPAEIHRQHFGSDLITPPVPSLKISHLQCYHYHRKMHKTNGSGYIVPCMTCKIINRQIRWRCSFCDLRICDRCIYNLDKTPGRELYMILGNLNNRTREGEPPIRRVETLTSGSSHGTERGESIRSGSDRGHSKQKSKGSVTTIESTGTGRGTVRVKEPKRQLALTLRSGSQASTERIEGEAEMVRRMEREKLEMGNVFGSEWMDVENLRE